MRFTPTLFKHTEALLASSQLSMRVPDTGWAIDRKSVV